MSVVRVNSPSPYDVLIEHGATTQVAQRVHDVGARKALIVFQQPLENIAQELAVGLRAKNILVVESVIPDAEQGKSLEVAAKLWDVLGLEGFSRQDVVISIGGGATTDLAGFVAATWMRGIKVIHVPTTLLAMVDAAVGGKTGINTATGKNLVGSFHEPDSVFIDLDRLATLPEAEIISGSAELIKTGFIADPRILELYEQGPEQHWAELVERSVAVKASVVGQDLKESGLREILNYGHTLGHAIERREQYRWRHGNAVAVGMVFVAELARRRGLIDDGVVQRHKDILQRVGLPVQYEPGAFPELYEAMTHDKKNRDGRIRFVVLDGIGKCTRIEDATVEELAEVYEMISGGAS